jgi:putative two-component system response regulator
MANPADAKSITTLLVVDDQPFFTTMLRNVLEQQGFKVFTASNGADGIRLAKQHRPGGILLDVEMPGMDGFAVCAALKTDEITKAIPVMFLTATNDPKLNSKAFAAGAESTALKSLSSERLVNLIRLTLGRGKGPQAS